MGERIICEGIKDYGLKEIHGGKSNPKILDWIKRSFPWATDDSTISWCGIWLAIVFSRIGLNPPDKFTVARNWTKIGEEVSLSDIRQGDICIFWRESISSWKGHVAIYTGQKDDKYLYVLGGNQSNKVGIKGYSIERLLSIRRL